MKKLYIKIKEFIKNKPYLKKAFKIIYVTIVTCSLLLNAFVIGSLIYERCNRDYKESRADYFEPLDTEPQLKPKGAMNNDSIYVFTSSYDIHSIIGYLLEYYDIPNYNMGDKFYAPRSDQPLGTINVPFCTFDRYNANDWTASNFNYSISYFCLTLDSSYRITGANNIQFQVFGMSLYACGYNPNTSQETRYWRYAIDYFPGYNSSNQRVYNSYSINYGSSTSINGFFFIDKYTNPEWYEAFTYDTHTNGYENGYVAGYESGLTAGYYDGLADQNGSPFSLISRAFSSLASILDIQIIPGITFGILIFTPIIVMVFIVLFKMFKG